MEDNEIRRKRKLQNEKKKKKWRKRTPVSTLALIVYVR